MHRFIIAPGFCPGDEAALDRDEAHHAHSVLRVSEGDSVCLSDGEKLYRATIVRADSQGVSALLAEEMPACESPLRLTVYQGLPKADKLETLAQKLTELGASELVPVRMLRSVVRLDARDAEKKRQRLERIAQEAVKQCGRAVGLSVSTALDWSAALARFAGHELVIMPWEEAREGGLARLHAAHPGARDVALVIGPEGGIDRSEMEAAVSRGAHVVTLGPRILRTETAAMAAAVLAQQLWGDMA